MQVLILYYSKTGNTKKLAQEVEKGVKEVAGVSCILRSSEEVTEKDFLDSSAIIAGSPVYFGGMAGELKIVFDKFVPLRKKMEGKVGAAFATSGSPFGGNETTMLSILQALMIYGMIIVGDPLASGGHYGVVSVGAPDKDTMLNAQKLGKRVAEVAKKIFAL